MEISNKRALYEMSQSGFGNRKSPRAGSRKRIPSVIHRLRKESWRDNVFVERSWRSVKYEEVPTKASMRPGLNRSLS